MAEVTSGHESQIYKSKAEDTYLTALGFLQNLKQERQDIGEKDYIDCVRVSLQLNYSVFLYEVANNQKEGLRFLQKSIAEALDDFEQWDPEQKDSITKQVEIMQENINVWKQTVEADSDEEN